ncbi:MAG: ATP-binding protein [Phormidesmis sp.]
MQTSQSFIATQHVSFDAYRRMRDALVQQSGLFESVMTEAQFEAQFSEPASVAPISEGLKVDERSSSGSSGSAEGRASICFVLMRSPILNVLLTATPLTTGPNRLASNSDRLVLQASDVNSSSNNLKSNNVDPQAKASPDHHSADNLHSRRYAPSQRLAQQDPSEQADRTAALIRASLLKAAQGAAGGAAEGRTVSPSQSSDYEVKLSFDEQAISLFIERLTPKGLLPRQSLQPLPPKKSPQSRSDKTVADAKPLTQEHLVLSWTKQLAVAPDGSAQATLDNQLQQSLLLNQVITRIRHSLDLPAILETTVAQVREFLSADRLVLYQFEQIEAVDLSSPSSTKPFAEAAVHDETRRDVTSKDVLGKNDARDEIGSSENLSTTDLHTNSDAIIGRCTHAGHITYESRVSEAIPSVLNFSESACFMPALSIRSRYIMGQPVAVDDVDKQYAHAECLLDFLHQAQVKSKIIAPIIVQDQLWGLLIAHQCEDYRHWQETEVMFLQHIAEHLAVAISQAGLYQQLQKQTVSLESCVVERTQNLHDALLAAESANLTKGEFLSTMSHELRTPLTYIIGMSATLLRWSFGELSDRQRSYLNTINHSGEQLLEIINDILDFAKISSGRTFLDVSEFSLNALVQEIMDHFQSIADKQEVTLSLRFDTSPEQDAFQADTKRLKQILSNLIHNAIKFTPAGGNVTLRASRDGQMGVFQVEDTGIGIPESQRGLLFEKFKQLESPFQRQYSGTGLGLAMTKRLVELHGGTIQVKSTVGQGSVFSVRLPLQAAELTSDRYQVPLTVSDCSKRILLLEAQENSAAIICDLLTADGYEVIWQEDVEKMLSQLESLQPAMLIADLSLLSHDLDEIKKVQLSITDLGTKVLALLGQPMSQSSHIAHHDTLDKPIDPKILLEKVRQLTLQVM